MKELSIEEKAKAYDEALEIARQEYNTTENVERKQWLEKLFPELKESEGEDERIRKELISFFSDLPDTDTFRGIPPSKVIAWLKKQDEQKPTWSEEDEKVLEYALDMIEWYSGKNEDKSRLVSDWLKSLRPQNMCVYNPYKAVVESIAEMCESYNSPASNLSDFYDNVKVKCKDAKEYDSMFLSSE